MRLRVCDPAVGSGHFLIAAAHRIAKRLAAVRTGEGEPGPEAVHAALRDVIGHCLYGVDINPMAAELCKVSLWMEAMEPGKPLSFLDHRIVCGNSLLGTTPALIERGIPDDAFNPIEGDDKKVCAEFKKQNKQDRVGQGDMFFDMVRETRAEYLNLTDRSRGIDRIDDATPAGVRRKEQTYAGLVSSPEYRHRKLVADAWCAAFVWKKTKDFPYAITEQVLRRIEGDSDKLAPWMREEIESLTSQYAFLHPHIAFPDVFQPLERIEPDDAKGWKGGFDVMLGNPPWERVKLQEKEFFAQRSPEIANAPNAAARKKMIEALKQGDPVLGYAFREATREAEGASHILRDSGLYPLCGRGDVNLYTVFAEAFRIRLTAAGRFGAVLPSGIATDDTTKFYFQNLVETRSLVSFYDFENKSIFPAVHSSYKICLLTAGSGETPIADAADFAFFCHAVEDLRDPGRRFTLSIQDIELLNPNTRTCPIFRSTADAELTKAIYRRVPVLIREARDGNTEENPWGIKFSTMFHMSNDSHLFRTREQLVEEGYMLDGNVFRKRERMANGEWRVDEYLPLYEAKMAGLLDHRAARVIRSETATIRQAQPEYITSQEHEDPAVFASPLYWVDEKHVDAGRSAGWSKPWTPGWRRVSATTNERSFLQTVFPAAGFGDSLFLMHPSYSEEFVPVMIVECACIPFDYVVRQKMGGLNLSFYLVAQMPVHTDNSFVQACFWNMTETIRQWFLPRILELTYTAWDLEPFARDCGYGGPPFRWDEERRFEMRCELDAAFFHLYLPTEANGEWRMANSEWGVRDESPAELEALKTHFPTPRHAVDYIMDTFPIVKRKDEKQHGEYRTKRRILEIYDEMAAVMKANCAWRMANDKAETAPAPHAYQPHLDPPPGPPADAQGNFIPFSEWGSLDQHLISHIHPRKVDMDKKAIDRGRALIEILALLYSSPDYRMSRVDLEMSLILMHFDGIRKRIVSAVAELPENLSVNYPSVENMDRFLRSFNSTQLSIIDTDEIQWIGLGPFAETTAKLKHTEFGRSAFSRAVEALSALHTIGNTTRAQRQLSYLMEAEHGLSFVIQ